MKHNALGPVFTIFLFKKKTNADFGVSLIRDRQLVCTPTAPSTSVRVYVLAVRSELTPTTRVAAHLLPALFSILI